MSIGRSAVSLIFIIISFTKKNCLYQRLLQNHSACLLYCTNLLLRLQTCRWLVQGQTVSSRFSKSIFFFLPKIKRTKMLPSGSMFQFFRCVCNGINVRWMIMSTRAFWINQSTFSEYLADIWVSTSYHVSGSDYENRWSTYQLFFFLFNFPFQTAKYR